MNEGKRDRYIMYPLLIAVALIALWVVVKDQKEDPLVVPPVVEQGLSDQEIRRIEAQQWCEANPDQCKG